MHDYRRSTPFTSSSFRGNKNSNYEDSSMSAVEEILKAINDLRTQMIETNNSIAQTLVQIQREQLDIRRELVSVQREELNLKREEMGLRVDAVKNMKELSKQDDISFLRELDSVENEFLDNAIKRAKQIEENNRANIFR
jgi:hypothetical protein